MLKICIHQVLFTVLALQALAPQAVFINRGDLSFLNLYYSSEFVGNHEAADINARDGFERECLAKYGINVADLANRMMACFPLVTLVNSKIMVVHGGIPIEKNLSDIKALDRFFQKPVVVDAYLQEVRKCECICVNMYFL